LPSKVLNPCESLLRRIRHSKAIFLLAKKPRNRKLSRYQFNYSNFLTFKFKLSYIRTGRAAGFICWKPQQQALNSKLSCFFDYRSKQNQSFKGLKLRKILRVVVASLTKVGEKVKVANRVPGGSIQEAANMERPRKTRHSKLLRTSQNFSLQVELGQEEQLQQVTKQQI